MRPNPARVEELYSLAANTLYDKKVRLEYSAQLIALYREYISEIATKLRKEYQDSSVDLAALAQEGAIGILDALSSLSLSALYPTYASWVEKHIRKSIRKRLDDEARVRNRDRKPWKMN